MVLGAERCRCLARMSSVLSDLVAEREGGEVGHGGSLKKKDKQTSGELKAAACDQIGLSHMLPSLWLRSRSPCRNAGRPAHVRTPLAHWDAKLRCHSSTLPALGQRPHPSPQKAGRGREGAWPENLWVTGMLVMKSTWTRSKQEWEGGQAITTQLPSNMDLSVVGIFFFLLKALHRKIDRV